MYESKCCIKNGTPNIFYESSLKCLCLFFIHFSYQPSKLSVWGCCHRKVQLRILIEDFVNISDNLFTRIIRPENWSKVNSGFWWEEKTAVIYWYFSLPSTRKFTLGYAICIRVILRISFLLVSSRHINSSMRWFNNILSVVWHDC